MITLLYPNPNPSWNHNLEPQIDGSTRGTNPGPQMQQYHYYVSILKKCLSFVAALRRRRRWAGGRRSFAPHNRSFRLSATIC